MGAPIRYGALSKGQESLELLVQFQTHPIGPGAMSLTCINRKGLMSRLNFTAVFSLVELALISLSSADFEFRDALTVSGQIISEIYF